MNRMSPAALCDAPVALWDGDDDNVSRLPVPEYEKLRKTGTLLEHELVESAIQYTQEVKEAINKST